METGPKWYITRGQQRIGPLDASQLKHMARTEQLGPTEYVWKEGMAQWVQAQQVQGLFDPPPPDEPEPTATPAVDVSPVISAYVPPPQQAAAPLIGGSAPAAPSSSTKPVTIPSAPAVKPTEPVKATATSPTPAPQATAPSAATPAAAPVARPVAKPAPAVAIQRPALASARRDPLPVFSSAFDALIPILGGILILATIGIPWFSASEYRYGPVKVFFSWDILKRSFATGGQSSLGVWLIGSWVAGLAAIIITPLTRGALRGTIYTILGAIVVTLFLIAYAKIDSTSDFKSGLSELEVPLSFIAGILTFAAFVVTHLVRRSGSNTPLKITQFIVLGALVIISIILLITAFAANNSIWSQYGKYPIKAPYPGLLRAALLVNLIGTITACILLLLSAISGGRRGLLGGAGLLLLYVIVVTGMATDAVLESGAKDGWESLYTRICVALLTLGTFMILGAGLVQMIDPLRRGKAPVVATGGRAAVAMAPSASSGETVEQKFAKLDQLRKTGVISDAEYQQKRAELLKQI